MNILVTGGSGFLGKRLISALLKQGHSVKNIDLRSCDLCETVIGDVGNAQVLDSVLPGMEVVFHLAAWIEVGESVEQPQKYVDNNISATVTVLECMRKHSVQTFIFSSSAAVYGDPVRTPIKEDDRTLPINPYGMTKLAMEGLVSSYVRNFGFKGVALRYFNLYGPGEDHVHETHAVPRFIQQIKTGSEVTVWGDGSQKRDFVHIDDIVHAHLLALNLPAGFHYFNLSGKNATPVAHLIQLLEKVIGKSANVKNFPARTGDPQELFADSTKAQIQMGWEAKVELEQGLRETVEWFNSQSK